jgi:hypothetical protein
VHDLENLNTARAEDKTDSGNRKIVVDSGVMINANVARDSSKRSSDADLHEARAKVEALRREKEVTIPLLFIYLESYREKGEEPQAITVPAYK